ncbi:ferrous iron transport protein A [Altererythrobacter sp. KTW20L]|uniref:FeoA family protein n=1 Tax=Altererythrobacter sp. KTW20L TaxID=2942210 RepID=UPI0020C0F973|nr:FeoA family protein [Altererythrobacter sp. KTW20L]MCL6250386.1 ferrous iron transport protein A [Altererythrobacter sp. KTW20L]
MSPDSLTLDTLAPLTRAEITGVDWAVLAPEEAKRLRALGIDLGAEVTIAHRGIFVGKDPIAIEIGRMTVALRRVHARAMTVRVL